MNQVQVGKLIAKLRKEAGFTQKSLADALYVTDKAVSKWERGLASPDSSLLPKLCTLLDADIELLLTGDVDYLNHKWIGYLVVNDIDYMVYDKPAIDYLISYFMLVGIRNIYVKSNNNEIIKNRHLEQYGVKVYFCERPSIGNYMIVNGNILLFGSNLTRYFQSFMARNETIVPSIDGNIVPIIFTHKFCKLDKHYSEARIMKLGRGMINIPLNEDATDFVRIYQKYHCKVADLQEIAKNRGLIR